MRFFCFTLAVLAMAPGAYAFSSTTGSAMDPSSSSRYQDPDDNLPVAHLNDVGTLVPGTSQGIAIGSTGASFNMLAPSGPDAFQPHVTPPIQH